MKKNNIKNYHMQNSPTTHNKKTKFSMANVKTGLSHLNTRGKKGSKSSEQKFSDEKSKYTSELGDTMQNYAL